MRNCLFFCTPDGHTIITSSSLFASSRTIELTALAKADTCAQGGGDRETGGTHKSSSILEREIKERVNRGFVVDAFGEEEEENFPLRDHFPTFKLSKRKPGRDCTSKYVSNFAGTIGSHSNR